MVDEIKMTALRAGRFLRDDINGRTVKLLNGKNSSHFADVVSGESQHHINIIGDAIFAVSHGRD
jgi:hypothetical protein